MSEEEASHKRVKIMALLLAAWVMGTAIYLSYFGTSEIAMGIDLGILVVVIIGSSQIKVE